MNKDIVIVDYGMGNIFSVRKVIERLGFKCQISNSYQDIKKAGKIILPGVGHFGKAMDSLKKANLVEGLNEAALVKKTPFLGICLGMQLMATHSEEGDSVGLNWFDAEVVHFAIRKKEIFKVPHMGWNTISHEKPESHIFSDIGPDNEFYFVHSYHFVAKDPADVLMRTRYEDSFVSAIQKDNIIGVQFHPEKSHASGEQLIRNFLSN